jgi:hypothetical protein
MATREMKNYNHSNFNMKKYDKIQEFLTYGISLLSGVVCASVYHT